MNSKDQSKAESGGAVASSDLLGIRIATIDGTQHAKCEMCGKQEELRPYGPNGESVCFDCGMKDEDAAKRQFAKLLNGNDVVAIK